MAPKPMLMVAATGDWTRNTPKEEFPAMKAIYDLYGKGDPRPGLTGHRALPELVALPGVNMDQEHVAKLNILVKTIAVVLAGKGAK